MKSQHTFGDDMRNKLYKLLSLLLVVTEGCSLIKNRDTSCQGINQLKIINESVYLSNSNKIDCFLNYHFTPLGINDDILVGFFVGYKVDKKSKV